MSNWAEVKFHDQKIMCYYINSPDLQAYLKKPHSYGKGTNPS